MNKKRVLQILSVFTLMLLFFVFNKASIGLAVDTIKFSVSSVRETTGYIGESIKIADIEAEENDIESINILIKNINTGREYTVDEFNTFIPYDIGIIKVSYGTTIGMTYTYCYDINIIVKKAPVIVKKPVFNPAFLEGDTYILPEVEGIDYTDVDNPQIADVDIKAVSGTMEINIGTDRKYIPEVARNGDNVNIIYTLTSKNGIDKEELIYTIPVLKYKSENGINMENYFIQESIDNIVKNESGIIFMTESSDSKLTFANALKADDFDFEFSIKKDFNRMDSITLILKDYLNPEISLELKIIKASSDNAKSMISVNGETSVNFSGTFYDEGNNSISISISNKNEIQDSSETIIATVKEDMQGRPFNGFPSGRLILNININQVDGLAGIEILNINSQMFTNSNYDSVPPKFLIQDIPLRYNVGDRIYIPSALAIDVFDVMASSSITLVGNFISEDNITLNNVDASRGYYFIASKPGQFLITYKCTDRYDNTKSLPKLLIIRDTQQPSFELKGNIPQTVSVGDVITLPEYQIDDNGGKENVKVMITTLTPTNELRPVGEDGKVTFNVSGRYIIRYYIRDAYYNYVISDYLVEVN